MAKLRIYQSIENLDRVFLFTADPKEVSASDKDLMAKYGEPEVNFGGTFDNGAGITFTLPDIYAKVVSGLPYKAVFTPTVAPWNTDTEAKFSLYRTTMQTRFNAAYVALRANSDGFTSEYITNI